MLCARDWDLNISLCSCEVVCLKRRNLKQAAIVQSAIIRSSFGLSNRSHVVVVVRFADHPSSSSSSSADLSLHATYVRENGRERTAEREEGREMGATSSTQQDEDEYQVYNNSDADLERFDGFQVEEILLHVLR